MSEQKARSDVSDWRSGTCASSDPHVSSWSHWSHWSQPNGWRPRKDRRVHVYNVSVEYGAGSAQRESNK